jgi:tetratricopeptide (TPR) repeat protein
MSIADIPIIELQRMAAKAQQERNYAQAKSIYVCLIAVIKQKDGPKSDRLAVNFFQLAEVYAEENNYRGAQTLYERAIEIWKQSSQPDAQLRLSEAASRLHELSELEVGRALRQDRKSKQNHKDVA